MAGRIHVSRIIHTIHATTDLYKCRLLYQDALGGLIYVAKLPYVDVRRLAVIGFSQGGATALAIAMNRLPPLVEGLKPLAKTPITYTWIEDYEWLKAYPLRKRNDGGFSGLTYSVPWVMSEGDELGHVQISNRKAVAAGLTFRPLLTTARDTIAWRESDAVPEVLRKQPRFVITPEQEQALLEAWKARAAK